MPQCVAKSKQSQQQCRRDAVRGADKCYVHVGRKMSDLRAERDTMALAKKLMPDVGQIQPVENALTALAQVAGEAKAWKESVAALVADMKDDPRYRSKSGEQLRAEVALYERALDRLGRLLIDIAKLGLDERLVAIEEAQALRLELVLIAVLARFGVNGRDPEVRSVVAEVIQGTPAAVTR